MTRSSKSKKKSKKTRPERQPQREQTVFEAAAEEARLEEEQRRKQEEERQIKEQKERKRARELGKQLIDACESGNLIAVMNLIEKGPDLNYIGQAGKTALIESVGKTPILNCLLAQESLKCINHQMKDGLTALGYACDFSALVQSSPSFRRMAGKRDQNEKFEERVKRFQPRGQNLEEECLGMAGGEFGAAAEREKECELGATGGEDTVIIYQNKLEDKDGYQSKESQSGASNNDFCVAEERYNLETVKMLLDHGADPDIPLDCTQGTALMYSIYHPDNYELLRLLLNYKANVNHQNLAGDSPLMLACERGNPNVVKIFLYHGANIQLETHQGDTALLQTLRRYLILKRDGPKDSTQKNHTKKVQMQDRILSILLQHCRGPIDISSLCQIDYWFKPLEIVDLCDAKLLDLLLSKGLDEVLYADLIYCMNAVADEEKSKIIKDIIKERETGISIRQQFPWQYSLPRLSPCKLSPRHQSIQQPSPQRLMPRQPSPQTLGSREHSPLTLYSQEHSPLTLGPREHSPLTLRLRERSPLTLGPREHSPLTLNPEEHSPQTLCPREHGPQTLCPREHNPQTLCPREHSPQTLGPRKHSPRRQLSPQRQSPPRLSTLQHSSRQHSPQQHRPVWRRSPPQHTATEEDSDD